MKSIIYQGQKVITTELLAQAYQTTADNIRHNFNRNKERFVEEKHFFCLTGDELRTFKRDMSGSPVVVPANVNQFYLWTERGANRHSKILDTDMAWEQFENLEETYFRVKAGTNILPSSTPTTSPGGVANLVNIYRRIMCDQGSSPAEISLMARNIGLAYGIPLPDNFVKALPGQIPGQLTFLPNNTEQ